MLVLVLLPEANLNVRSGFFGDLISILQPLAFRRPSSLLPVCRLQKVSASKMSLCKSRACVEAMPV